MKNPYVYLAVLIAVILLVITGFAGVKHYTNLTEKAAQVEPLQKELKSLQETQKVVSEEVVTRAQQDTAVRTARQSVTTQLDKVTHEDPVARDYLSEPLPDGVRDAIRSQSRTVPATLQD